MLLGDKTWATKMTRLCRLRTGDSGTVQLFGRVPP